MQRRKFSREFKIEAVRLVGERGVSVAQASRDIDVHEVYRTRDAARADVFDYIERFLQHDPQALDQRLPQPG